MNFTYHDMIMSIGGQLLFFVLLIMVILLGMSPVTAFNAPAVRKAILSLPSLQGS